MRRAAALPVGWPFARAFVFAPAFDEGLRFVVAVRAAVARDARLAVVLFLGAMFHCRG
jgi:hypothetical protein